MKLTLIATISILSTIASGLALPELNRRKMVIRPGIAILIKEGVVTPIPPVSIAEASSSSGVHRVQTLLGFVVPPCIGKCTFSFSDALTAGGSRKLRLFTISRYPVFGDTWDWRPYTDINKGTVQVSATGVGPAAVVEDFGLTFPCPATAAKRGYQVSQVGDDDYVSWDITKGGFIITCG